MSRTVNVCIVAVCCLVFDVGRIDGDTSFLFLGSRVDLVIGFYFN